MKRFASLLLIFTLLLSLLTGCGTDEITETDTSQSTSDTQTVSHDTQIDISEPESPISNFEYAENDGGGMTITKYIGTEENVVIPKKINSRNVTCIGIYAFAGSEVQYVKIPDSVTVINHNAFRNCTSLTTVIFSQNLTAIWDEAFMECSSLSNIVLPDSLTHIAHWAFAKCTSLKHINIPEYVLSDASGSVFNSSGLETVTLEEQTIIPFGVFAYTKLKEIVLPDTVKQIQSYSFSNCSELQTVILNTGIEKIDYDAFAYSQITEIIIPETVKTVTEMSFRDCKSLKKVKFEGNAPETFIDLPLDTSVRPDNLNFVVYHRSTATGFTSPEWYGYTTEVW